MNVQGKITDASTGETIPGANVFFSDASGTMLNPPKGATTDINGNYSLVGDGYITATFVGLKNQTKKIDSGTINFDLQMDSSSSLPEVNITAKKPFNWKLWLGVALLSFGAAYFTVSILKYKKIIA